MSGFDVGALLAELDVIAEESIGTFERHPVVQAWLAGRADRDRVFAFQAQLYHQVAQTVPELMGCARTCARLAADEPMYAPLARHFARHAAAESEPAPHDVLLLEDLRRQGFPVERLPAPCPSVQRYLAQGRWAIAHAPLQEIGRAYVLEALGQRLAPRAVDAQPAQAGAASRADRFYQVHAEADRPGQGHVDQDRAILCELSGFAAFAARAGDVLTGARHVREYHAALWADLDAEAASARAAPSGSQGGDGGAVRSGGDTGRVRVTRVP